MVSVTHLATILAAGAVEGYVMARSGLPFPKAVKDQMDFTSNIILKVFLSAVGFSMTFQSALSIIAPQKWEWSRGYRSFDWGFARVCGGCGLTGCGMALAGSGPTLLPTQLATSVSSAWHILAGSVVGGMVFDLAERWKVIDDKQGAPPPPTITAASAAPKTIVEDYVGGKYHHFALPVGLMLIAAAAGLNHKLPNAQDLTRLDVNAASFIPFSPLLVGAVVGLNQIPMRLISECGQGGSRSVMNVIGTCTNGFACKRFQVHGSGDAWQLVFVWGGTLIGAIAGRYCSPGFVPADGGSNLAAFVGGAVILFGSRLAGGCTCGHGVTGMSELNVQSIAGAMSIFGGGIATRLALNFFGVSL